MECDKFLEKIDLYIHNEISANERAELDSHISECENCRNELEFARKINAALRNLPLIETPPDFKDRLHEKIKAERKNKFYKMWQPYAAFAACFVLAVVLRSGAGDMLDSLKASEVTPVPIVKSEVGNEERPAEVLDKSAEEYVAQATQKPVAVPNKQPKKTNKNKPSVQGVSKQQESKVNTDVQSNAEIPSSGAGLGASEPVSEIMQSQKNENTPAEVSDDSIQNASQEDAGEKKAAVYSARSSFPEIQYNEVSGEALASGAASAPAALKAFVDSEGEEYGVDTFVMNVDNEGRRIVDSFMNLNMITKSYEVYNMSRDNLKLLIDELESGGAEYELMFEFDDCGDMFDLIIVDI